MSDAVLKVENLKVHFPVKGGLFTKKQVVKAVDGVALKSIREKPLDLLEKAAVVKVPPVVQSSSFMSPQAERCITMERMLRKSKAAILRNSAGMYR